MAELPADAETEPVCGRPQVEVDMGEVDKLIRMGFTKTKIADIMGISRKTLYTKIMAVQQQGPSGIVSNRYVQMTDDELDTKVKSIKQTHPQYGEVMIVGHLRQDGIRLARSCIRASIHRVDPDDVAERRSKAVKRRVYQVGFPNDIWHIDGNHKLIRWRFVVHGGIDGFSRLITFLACNSNNCAKTMLNAFEEGIQKCGRPRKIRSDHGGENVDVWRSVMMAHGSQQCVIVGSSTHNERIERLWRDVHRSVLLTFSTLFRELESREHLDPLNEIDIYCLQKIILPIINEDVKMSTTEVGVVLFADDVMLLTERKEDMEANLKELKKAMSNWGMKIHWGKTKVMMVSRKGEECKVCVDGEGIEQVQNMKYLGAILSADGTCEEEIEQRVGAAARVIGAMRKEVLERKELKKATKMRVYNAIVLPTMLYGSETWTVMKRHESRLGATEMAYLRRVEGVTRMDRVRNADVREAVGQEEVMEKVKRKQRAWKEKLEQMEDNRLVKKVYTEEIAGKRPRGRPRKKWIDSF